MKYLAIALLGAVSALNFATGMNGDEDLAST